MGLTQNRTYHGLKLKLIYSFLDWNPKQNQEARPGSTLGQVFSSSGADQAVKTVASGWSELAKSKSSAAVLVQEAEDQKRKRRGLSRERPPMIPTAVQQEQSRLNLSEAHTNQVHETVNKWGKVPER